jgi:hypothetical protein
MAIQRVDARVQEQYAGDTALWMKQVAVELGAIECARVRSAANLYAQLHQQEEASRLAGFSGVSRLCRQMQDCLNKAQEGGLPQLRAAARMLLGVCRTIEVHALSVGKSAHRMDSGGERGHRNAAAGNKTTPHATILASSTLESCCLAETD